ncbi:MAG TPA: MotA/TolQ/ExbB proton channel family protein [Candidatus Polarisedimenticolia bacterium]|jgi:biopolymer transport protein TolQ|nr:MotA/TolQ/ExbB proton channel family protein [Candidatus Polarisedimenticolia bacterium]
MLILTTPVLAAASAGYGGDVLRLIADSGALVKFVLLILLGFSVLSWAVIFERYRGLKRAEEHSARFLQALDEGRRLADLKDHSTRFARSPLVPIFLAGFRELTSGIAENVSRFRGSAGMPDEARDRILERVRRRLEEAAAAEADHLDSHLGILATTGTVTPFVGLFGTVWGIMNAFQGIGITGSASLAAVAPGISEALVTTAAGLFAAIPAVIGYNVLLARARRLGGRIDRFVLHFASIAETQIEAGRTAAATAEAAKVRL